MWVVRIPLARTTWTLWIFPCSSRYTFWWTVELGQQLGRTKHHFIYLSELLIHVLPSFFWVEARDIDKNNATCSLKPTLFQVNLRDSAICWKMFSSNEVPQSWSVFECLTLDARLPPFYATSRLAKDTTSSASALQFVDFEPWPTFGLPQICVWPK